MKKMKHKLIYTSILSTLATGVSLGQVTTVTYDFNGQWNGDWETYKVQTGGPNVTPAMNYSKKEEGRQPGAGGNRYGGTVGHINGFKGSLSSIYEGLGALSLSSANSGIRLRGSYSAFANQPAFTGGSSEVGQVGLLCSPSLSNSNSSVLKQGDSVYLGFKELSWTGQNVNAPYPGSAEIQLGIYKDGVLAANLGTFHIDNYGARVGSQIWAKYFEYDLLFKNEPNGTLSYDVTVNALDFYDAATWDGVPPVEGTPVNLGSWQGNLGARGGLRSLRNLYVAYGAYIAPDGKASVSGYTFDHLPVPEPSSTLLLGVAAFGFVLRRKR